MPPTFYREVVLSFFSTVFTKIKTIFYYVYMCLKSLTEKNKPIDNSETQIWA